MTTNRTRMILPEECEGYRFGVGHAEFGLEFFKPLSDSHLAQHFSMLSIVPTEACYLTKVTSHNHGSPQIARVLRDREDQADRVGGQKCGTGAGTLDRVQTVQELIFCFRGSREVYGDHQSFGDVRASFGRCTVWRSAPAQRAHCWWRRTCSDFASRFSADCRYRCSQPYHPSLRT